jgi:hypothetical protein
MTCITQKVRGRSVKVHQRGCKITPIFGEICVLYQTLFRRRSHSVCPVYWSILSKNQSQRGLEIPSQTDGKIAKDSYFGAEKIKD